jgi:chromosome partitioning protein
MERAAFSGVFAFGGDLYSMPEQGNMSNAKANAKAFAKQVYKRLVEDD